MNYWLMKSEPDVFSIDDLARHRKTSWEGVRNYQARNFMRDQMKVGDLALYYHSNADPSGVAGVVTISQAAHPDPTQFDKQSEYYDPKSTADDPRWVMVEVSFKEAFDSVISLEQLRAEPALAGMAVLKRGQRLSVQPVDAKHFRHVLKMAKG